MFGEDEDARVDAGDQREDQEPVEVEDALQREKAILRVSYGQVYQRCR
jgi:hypothetical protein